MKFSWLICVVFLAVCMICEVVGDYSESLLPSKEFRNRVHRTMRMNMRVGKRYGEEYDDEVAKRGLRRLIRTGKRSDPQLPTNTQHTLDTFLPLDTVDIQEPKDLNKRGLRKRIRTGKRSDPQLPTNTQHTLDTFLPLDTVDIQEPKDLNKRGLRMLIRTGKRSDPQLPANTQHTLDTFLPLDIVDIQEPKGKRNYLNQVRFYADPQRESEGNISPDELVATKRNLRMIMRTGKRNTQSTLDTPSEQFDTYSDDRSSEDFLLSPDYKRSSPQFLLNPRVGKNDKTWTVQALNKRGDPKAADMWFGPRIGRSSVDQLEEYPWSYVIFNNGNRLSPVLKSNELEEQSKDNGSD